MKKENDELILSSGEINENDELHEADTAEVAEISERLLKRNAAVYEELAK